MTQLEFRLLQVVLSHVSGDKRTLALLHWDGVTLRVADALDPLAAVDPMHREAVRVTAEEWIRRARAIASDEGAGREQRRRDLAEVLPVRQGLGAALLWTPVTSIEAIDAAAHFDTLVHELHLDREPSSSGRGEAATCVAVAGACAPPISLEPVHWMPVTAASCRE